MKKTGVFLFICLFVTGLIFGQNVSDFKTNGKGMITEYTGKETVIVIPSKIGNETITAIGDSAFRSKNLTGVTIPNSVKFIGVTAFCSNKLTSISIGANVELAVAWNEETSSVFDWFSVFDYFYYNGGKKAGTYTRPNADSKEWSRK